MKNPSKIDVLSVDAKLPGDGLGAHAHGHANIVCSAHPRWDEDSNLPFFKGDGRSGVDLIVKDDREPVLQFRSEKRAALSSPDGAHLTGNIVNALTGYVEYTRAGGAPDAAKFIGHIQTAIGSSALTRAGGIAVQAKVGDPVCQGDVIETAADGRVGLCFIDGAGFELSGSSRVVLDEFVCDPDGTSHSALFGVTRGTFSFIVGQMAKAGCLRIGTPAGSIQGGARTGGIGMLSLTALIFSVMKEVEAAEFSSQRPLLDLLDDDTIKPKDLQLSGVIELFLRDGRHYTLDDPGQTIVISGSGSISVVTNSATQMAELQRFQQEALATYALGTNTGPTSRGGGGSSTPPSLLLSPQGLQPINFDQPVPQNLRSGTTQSAFISPANILEAPVPSRPPVLTLAVVTPMVGNSTVNSANILNASGASSGLVISGTTDGVENGQTVMVTIVNSSGVAVETFTTAVANNAWSVNVSPTNAQALSDGSYTVMANVSNALGTAAPPASQSLTVDQTPPAPPGAALTTDSGSSNSDHITNVAALSLSVIEPGASVEYSINGGATWTASFTPAEGPNTVLVRQTDAAGNVSTASSFSFTLDTAPPAATLAITAIATDTGTSNDFITSNTTLIVSGTNGALAQGEKIQLSSDGGATWHDVTQTGPSWSYDDTANPHGSSFSYSARIVDAAGNIGSTTSQVITIDTTAPGVTFDTVSFTDTGVQGDHTTDNGQVTLSGTVLDNVLQVQVFNGSQLLGTAIVDNVHHTWTLTTTLAPGAYNQFNATATDEAGNLANATTTQMVQVNNAPVLAPINPTLTAITEDQTTNATDPGQTVSSFIGASISDVDAGAVKGIAITGLTSTNGTWQYSFDGGTTWTAISAVGNSTALLLDASDKIRFLPDGNNGGTDTITYRAWDETAGTHGTTVDTSTNGGTRAFSTATDTAHLTVTSVNDAPVITTGAAAARVSEEGLTNGVPDSLPAGLDTTDSTSASGTITATDVDGDALTMSLGTPSASLTSGGVAIAWTLQDAGHTLIGKAGTATIITATITDGGTYNVALSGPIDHSTANQEDNATFTVPVIVSDGHTTTPTTLSVTIEDDSPKTEPVEVSVIPTDSKTNVMLILDLSGSMGTSSGLTGLTRLDVAKAAISELLDQYDNRGDVMVRIVTFSTTGAAVGSAWQGVADAKAAIAGLSAGGNTNYDAALLTAMGAFADGTKLTGPGTQNVSYFLSDGDPTASSDWPQIPGTQSTNGIQANEQAVWESFLTTNKIVSFALGIPNVSTPANLDPIAFDPASGAQLADTPIIVTDPSQLANTLVFTIPPVTGGVLAGAPPNSFGADGGFVQSITVDGVTYAFNPAANGGAGGITTSGGGSFTYDGTTKTLTVDTDTNAIGGELAMVMTTGAFTFQPPTGFSSESVGFVLVDRDGDTANSTIQFSAAGGSQILPAGVSGSPMNLGLTDPAGHVGSVTVAIAGVPSGWTLSEGTDNGDGSWTIQASSVPMLSIASPANYAGAMALQVTMSWTNADGSSGFARATDNVEVFAQGAPVFAWSGEDHLTGSSGKDLFVFAQPIGHDTIYSFEAAHDQLDLIGYAGFTSFADIEAHLADDANGDAVITLGDGQSIELQGVHAVALTENNFVFDHTPTVDNAATMTIGDGSLLPLSGSIVNTGTIALNSTGDETDLQLIEPGATLEGGGRILLSDSDTNIISGTSSGVTLNNEDNTISGAGQLGSGELTLTNAGTIDATGTHTLTIDTGSNLVKNSGVLEASGSGGMMVASGIVNSGVLWANGATLTVQGTVSGNGTATIDGIGTLDFEASTSANVVFGSGTGGTLKLGNSFHFNGTISGFGGSDVIDLANVAAANASISYHENTAGSGGTLAISNGAQTLELSLLGHYSADNFSIVPDQLHGTSIIYVPHDLML